MTSPIFYVDSLDHSGDKLPLKLRLEGDEAHHALKVKRLEVGEGILISDGRGAKLAGVVEQVEDDTLLIRLDTVLEENTDFELVLVQALAKSDRDLLAIEMATELGITSVLPWEAERSIVRWKANRAAKAHQKWQNTVKAAAKQARRGLIPQVADLVTSKALPAQVKDWVADGLTVLILHEDASQKLAAVLEETTAGRGFVFIVGPEGGISPQEVTQLTEAGAQLISLGSEVLRSSTAGAAVLSAIHYAYGRWS